MRHNGVHLPCRLMGKLELIGEVQVLAERVRWFQKKIEEEEKAFEEVGTVPTHTHTHTHAHTHTDFTYL